MSPFMSNKYPRIMHFPFSPNATNDDRIAGPDWYNYIKDKQLIFLEKFDGQNQCLSSKGVFARTHAVVDRNPWSTFLWPLWDAIKNDLGDLEIFGENMYAVHSIEYERLYSYFYVFGVRENGIWKSWNDTKWIAEYFGFQYVPEYLCLFEKFTEKQLQTEVERRATKSFIGNTCEGVVVRVSEQFDDPGDSTMGYNILKYVRKNHVQTDEHWTRGWRKAKLYNIL